MRGILQLSDVSTTLKCTRGITILWCNLQRGKFGFKGIEIKILLKSLSRFVGKVGFNRRQYYCLVI